MTSLGSAAQEGVTSVSFASRSGPRGSTMFTVMPPAETGVVAENRYADPKMWTEHYQELAYGAIGTGVAIGDFDNDGRPDVFVVSKTETSRLFRNLGSWKFEDVTQKAGLAAPAANDLEHWRQGATFVDVNNDGWLDLYVCRFGAPNLLYLNKHDGTFEEQAAARGLAVDDASGMAAFCDYDRDGWLDAYILTSMLDATKGPKGQPDYLFHNKGDGTFTDVTARAGISGAAAGHSATWWDFDEDGWPDLYVANDYDVPDRLYRNNRDGTFTDVLNQTVPHTAYYAMGADVGDVNNDGRLDLFVADMAASTHEKDQRGMAGSRARAQQYPADRRIAPQHMRNVLCVSTGRGRLLEAAYLAGLPATDWTWSPRFEDLDNDGLIDLHVTNGMTREYHNADLLERMMGIESQAESRSAVKASPPLAETNFAFRNRGDLRFEDASAAWGLNQQGVSFGSALGDLDGDGDLDLVFGNYLAGPTVLRNDSDTGNRLILQLRGTRSNRFGIGAVVRVETAEGVQVRQLSLARGYGSSSEPIVHFGLGAQTAVKKIVVSWPSGVRQELASLDANRRFTLREPTAETASTGNSPVSSVARPIFRHLPTAGMSAVPEIAPNLQKHPAFLPLVQGLRSPTLATADFDGDGRPDLAIGGTDQQPLQLYRTNGDGSFAAFGEIPSTVVAGTSDGPIVALDFDGNGTADLLVTKTLSAAPAAGASLAPILLLNDGHGNFRRAGADTLASLSLHAGAAAAADINRDGKLDVFIGGRPGTGLYPNPGRSALLLHRGDKFEDVTEQVAPGLRQAGVVSAALFSDVDRDGYADLVVALEWGGLQLWHNEAGQRFTNISDGAGFTSAGTGLWLSLATADFNGDGRPDFAVGNLGLNTRYEATAEHPALLFFGDLGGSTPFALEAHFEGNKLVPWLSRGELAGKAPNLVKKFPRTDLYARAALDEIVGAERLARARRFAITELQSGVLLSEADGTYRFRPFPRLAQIAAASAMAAGDFNRDGKADLLIAQNSDAPVASIGRFDGGVGQLLLGDGAGNFRAISADESGCVAPGAATGVAALDLDGDGAADVFVIGRHADAPVVLQVQPPTP